MFIFWSTQHTLALNRLTHKPRAHSGTRRDCVGWDGRLGHGVSRRKLRLCRRRRRRRRRRNNIGPAPRRRRRRRRPRRIVRNTIVVLGVDNDGCGDGSSHSRLMAVPPKDGPLLDDFHRGRRDGNGLVVTAYAAAALAHVRILRRNTQLARAAGGVLESALSLGARVMCF